MSAAGRWYITDHAVERYCERFARGLTYEQALGVLIHMADRAHRVKVHRTGLVLYRLGKPEKLRFLVDEDVANAPGQLPKLVTVLPQCDGWRWGGVVTKDEDFLPECYRVGVGQATLRWARRAA